MEGSWQCPTINFTCFEPRRCVAIAMGSATLAVSSSISLTLQIAGSQHGSPLDSPGCSCPPSCQLCPTSISLFPAARTDRVLP